MFVPKCSTISVTSCCDSEGYDLKALRKESVDLLRPCNQGVLRENLEKLLSRYPFSAKKY
jgi:hypothetical protein